MEFNGVIADERNSVAYPIPASRKTLTPSGLLGNGKPVKTRCVIHEQLSLARLADIFSLAKDIDRAVEPIAVRDVRAVHPALVAELFDGEGQEFFVNLEAKVNLATLDLFFG
jgi:hypothetical protein